MHVETHPLVRAAFGGEDSDDEMAHAHADPCATQTLEEWLDELGLAGECEDSIIRQTFYIRLEELDEKEGRAKRRVLVAGCDNCGQTIDG